METKLTSPILKGIIIALLIQFLAFPLHAQDPWSWSTPVAITDSVSNNCNPFLLHSWHFDDGSDVLMIWEKSTDTASTAIYMKFLSSPEDEVPILSDSGVHYTNPVIMQGYFNQILFMLFYESDQTGVKNIHYMIYDYDGNFSEPQPFFHTPYDDNNVDVSWIFEQVVWTSNGELKSTKYNSISGTFTEPETISTGICANPKILWSYVYWEMKLDSIFQIFRSNKVMNEWTEPVMITGYEDVRNLSKSHDVYQFDNIYVLIWSALSDSTWKMIIDGPSWVLKELYPENNEPFDPAIASPLFGVKESSFSIFHYVSFADEENGFMEIFVNPGMGEDFINLSSSGTNNRNPVLFVVEGVHDNSSGFFYYLLWESDRNGYWQLFYSRLFTLAGNVEERSSNSNILTVSPNPADDHVTLSYWLDEPADVQLVLTDFSGKIVATYREGYKDQGAQSTEINLSNPEISPGTYIICLVANEKRICTKLIKTR